MKVPLISVCTIGFAVEYAWAAGETVMVPYLVEVVGVTFELAALVFMVNPWVAVLVQPLIGKLSDFLERRGGKHGGRVPIVLGLTVSSLIGIGILLFAEDIDSSHIAVLSFVAFGLLDISHDGLLVPARAYINDLAIDDGIDPLDADEYHSYFSIAQALGRLVSLIFGSLPIRKLAPSLREESAMFKVMMSSSAVVIFFSCFSTFVGSHYRHASRSSDVAIDELSEIEIELVNEGDIEGDDSANSNGSLVDDVNSNSNEDPPVIEQEKIEKWKLAKILIALSMGWVGYMAVCFYWTEHVGLKASLPGTGGALSEAVSTLAVQATVGCVAGFYNAKLNNKYGLRRIFIASLVFSGFSLILAPHTSGWLSVIALLPQGLAYAIHQTNSQLLVQQCVPSSQLGFAASLATATMSGSQILAAGLAALLSYLSASSPFDLFTITGVIALASIPFVLKK